jgi:hypothetical protein
VFDAATVKLLEGGCALIVGSVDGEGAPHASRGWGLDVLDASTGRIRLLLDVHDDRARANLVPGRPVAVTGADVATLASVQLKGTSAGEDPPAPSDPARMRRYTGSFYTAIHETDGTDPAVVERITPEGVVAIVVDVIEAFDQTPGPAAGRPVDDGGAG